MIHKNGSRWTKYATVIITMLVTACSSTSTPSPTQPTAPVTPTATPTMIPGAPEVQISPSASRCAGLSGELEMQILVGPADAVGLEPVAVGIIPFSVVSEGEPYILQGNGEIAYSQVLEQEWGTYSVTLDMQSKVEGECVGTDGGEVLNITIESSGEQMVEVRAEGMQGDYPWSGTRVLDLSFPLADGAMAQGEGWVFVLNLSE